jgi:hypothetical protein
MKRRNFFNILNFGVIASCIVFKNNKHIYVSKKGDDRNNGYEQYPVKTITRALQISNNGNIIFVDSGIYDETFIIKKEISLIGKKDMSVVVRPYKKPVHIDADNVFISYFVFDGRYIKK